VAGGHSQPQSWDNWLADLETFEQRWSQQRSAVQDWDDSWGEWRTSTGAPPGLTDELARAARTRLADADRLAHAWTELAQTATRLHNDAPRSAPEADDWIRHAAERAKAARNEHRYVIRRAAEHATAARKVGMKDTPVTVHQAIRVFLTTRTHKVAVGVGMLAGTTLSAFGIWFLISILSPLFTPAGSDSATVPPPAPWPCSLMSAADIAGITGQPTGLIPVPGYPGQYGCEYGPLTQTGPQPQIDFGWQRTDWPTWRKDHLTCRCTTSVDALPIPAVYCPAAPGYNDSGQLYFPLGGYAWVLAERHAQSVNVGYQQMLALTNLLITHYQPPTLH
jgi:hypothetical protein